MKHSRLFVRSYLILAGGLLLAASVLDFAFSELQSRQALRADPWHEATFQWVEQTFAHLPAAERANAAAKLSESKAIPAQLLSANDVGGTLPTPHSAQSVIDAAGNSFVLRYSKALDAVVRLGPIQDEPAQSWTRWLPILFYLSILLIVGWWLRPLLKDLQILTDASQRFAVDYRDAMQTRPSVRELTSLAAHMDEMSQRIGELIRGQKELTAALSHEMRTPLARIRMALGVIEPQTPNDVRPQISAINTDIQQLDELIASMLHYARLDHPGLKMEWRDTALEQWLRDVIAGCGARDKHIEVIRPDSYQSANMDPRLMQLALSNLVSNACRYARHRVTIIVSGVDQNRIIVEDDGEGIPRDGRDEILKPFTRLDTSRNRDTGGFGLGLAIVARVADLHRGVVKIGSSTRLGGARLTFEWPKNDHELNAAQ